MKAPLSWIKDFVDITLPLEELAHRLTMAGLEVEEIRYVGLPLPKTGEQARAGKGSQSLVTKITGIEWDPETIVVGAIHEVMPHPNADRLVLCRLEDGKQEHIILTGASNLFQYKGKGPLEKPLKVAYAREGAKIFDGHQPGQMLVTLKRAKIRGVESYSMACSEKELGISDDHEGIILLDDDAPIGSPLVDYMGDAVLDIAITPNIARDANILGIAREIAALTNQKLRMPSFEPQMEGKSIQGRVSVDIHQPEVNPRFVLGLIEDIRIAPSPYQVQRRLRLAGMRPINNVVDATNYAMLEVGEPLHAFDYDVLVQRAGSKPPALYTRRARRGERLVTLDGVERQLDDFTVLVCDTAGLLSLAGVMGGAETEVSDHTRNVLLEGAAWNIFNTRRTVLAQNLPSEAAYRFSRGVHPTMAELGVRRGLEWMRRWTGGRVAQGLVDNYPLPQRDPTVEITPGDVERWLGIQLAPEAIANLLRSLEFEVQVHGQTLRATAPDHRLDIGEGVIGVADVLEEVARVYGYDRIPESRMADSLPLQRGNPTLEREDQVRDLLVNLGLQEVITYRITSPEREARLRVAGERDDRPYLRLANPIVSDRVVMRRSLLSSVMEVVERNARLQDRLAIFEIGPVFLPRQDSVLPDEPSRLAIAMTGPRALTAWQGADTSAMDFYDLKGVLAALLENLHIPEARFEPAAYPCFHPGKSAVVSVAGQAIGAFGELHPLVRERYELAETPLLAAELDMDLLLSAIPDHFQVRPVQAFPPVLEDLAVILDDAIPAERVAELILKAGQGTVTSIQLFDVYRGEQVGEGKKSLAYSLTYQASDRTLTDEEVSKIRKRIVGLLEKELNANLRR